MKWNYDSRYPAIEDLRDLARRRVPRFAFEYLDGGCNEDVNLRRNTDEIRDVTLQPYYLRGEAAPDMRTELFGHVYDAPIGIAPVGLQGLVWPGAPEILARAATAHNLPFILSTVTTASIETIGAITEGKAWFQLYNPAEDAIREDIFLRLEAAGYRTLVLLCDVPSFGFRPRDIRNGLSMPPRMTLANMIQIAGRPNWALRTLAHGIPAFQTMKKYMDARMSMKQLGQFMNRTFHGRLDMDALKTIRDRWKGNLVLKGVATEEDAQRAVSVGLDGLIVSNHGGRQVDCGESAIASLRPIVARYKDKLRVMMDSGIRSGPDVARVLASGADFAFLGRTFMYSVGALGAAGGDHAIGLLKTQLYQVLDQLGCRTPKDLPGHRELRS